MSSYSDYANAVSRIEQHTGDVQAGAIANRGAIIGSTIATLGAQVPKQIQDAISQAAEKRKQAQIQQILQQAGPDLRSALPQIRAIDHNVALGFEKELNAADEVSAKAAELKQKHEKELREFQLGVLASAQNESQWASGIAGLHQAGVDVSGFDPTFSPEAVKRVNVMLATPDARLKANEPPKPPEDFTLSEGQTRFTPDGTVKASVPKPEATITPYQQAELEMRAKEFGLSQQRLALAVRQSNKPAIAKESSGLADAVIANPVLFGQLTPTAKEKIIPELQKRGFTDFAKPPSATVENRLASAQAVQQTGNDIVSQLNDPKVRAMLGPALGRFNSLREFIGNPPPELSDLAGSIESYALANMGVHGMRSVQGAEQIKALLDRKHTPESLIATINGLNRFSQHFLENEDPKRLAKPAGAIPAPSAPAGGLTYQDYLKSKGGK